MATDSENNLTSMMSTVEVVLNEARLEETTPYEKSTFRPFLFFGSKIPIIHRPGLYLHLFIVSLQYFFFFNTKILLGNALDHLFNNIFDNKFFFPLLSTLAYLILPFIVYFCDRQMIRRYYLVLVCLVMAFLSSCFLLTLLILEKFEPTNETTNVTNASISVINTGIHHLDYSIPEYIMAVLSLILFSISFVLSDSFTITFGLDILHGTHFETLLLYFPLFYISRNIGGSFAYIQYIKYTRDESFIHCSVSTFVVLIAVLLLIIGRLCGFFKDSPLVANNFSFKRGIKLIFSALKLKIIHKKRADFKSLMLYTGTKNNYHDPKSLVSRTVAMVKINLIFIILTPLLGSYQILYQLFPEQSNPLTFLLKPITQDPTHHHCIRKNYLISYFFANPLTIVVFAVVFEFFFNDIVFNVVKQDLPRWIRCIPRCLLFIRNNCIYGIRKKLHAYLTLADPILKRVFWGLPFGLLSVLCGFTVEVLRIHFSFRLNCTAPGVEIYYGSYVPLIAQVPQYILSAMQETLSTIGLLQYVYYLCSEHFQNSLRGFFFSLFFFYYGVAGFAANLAYFTFDQICHDHCLNTINKTPGKFLTSTMSLNYSNISSEHYGSSNQLCFVFNSDCNNEQPNGWVVWVIAILLYLTMIPLFYWFSHYKHWKRVRDLRLHELSWNEAD